MYRLRWWFCFWMNLAVLIGLSYFGFAQKLWHADATKLGPAIIILYLGFTCYVGRLTVLADTAIANWRDLKGQLKACDLMVKSLVILGIIGTTCGLLIMLNAAFAGEMNPATVLAGLKQGLSTLGITTLIGLACYLLLEVQVLNLEFALEA